MSIVEDRMARARRPVFREAPAGIEAPAPPGMPAAVLPYRGRFPRIDDPLMRAAYLQDVSISAMFYRPGTADWRQKATQVALNSQTAEWLYTGFTPLELRYKPGSRPKLEEAVGRVVRPGMTERERVLAILGYCWGGFRADYPAALPKDTIFLNAIEEDILALGGGQCEDRARLIICLCQIAGFPARLVASYTYYDADDGFSSHGGHAIVEVFLEAGWAFFDSTRPFLWLRPDGRLASLWDLVQRPGWARRQSESVMKSQGLGERDYARYQREYLTDRQVIALANYNVWEADQYDWTWVRYEYGRDAAMRQEMNGAVAALKKRSLAEAGVETG